MIGYEDGLVRPQNQLTRAEAATIFFRLLTDDVRAENWTQNNSFSDVKLADWYNNAVSVMSVMKIINGYPNGTYDPNGNITRAQLATIAARFARLDGNTSIRTTNFTDISGHWAEEDILFAASVGWLDGYEDGSFNPDAYITRAEFMVIVNRMLDRIPESVDDLLAGEMITWADNADTGAWYYIVVQEATNSHEHDYKDVQIPERNSYYEFWTEFLPVRDWSLLEKEWSDANSLGTV